MCSKEEKKAVKLQAEANAHGQCSLDLQVRPENSSLGDLA